MPLLDKPSGDPADSTNTRIALLAANQGFMKETWGKMEKSLGGIERSLNSIKVEQEDAKLKRQAADAERKALKQALNSLKEKIDTIASKQDIDYLKGKVAEEAVKLGEIQSVQEEQSNVLNQWKGKAAILGVLALTGVTVLVKLLDGGLKKWFF